MGSTYLQLTNKVLRLLNETELTSSNFADSKGVYNAAKDGVNHAINHINNEEYEWPFNHTQEQSKTLAVGTTFYSFEADFKVADWESFYIFNDGTLATQTYPLKLINYEEWHRYQRQSDYDNTTSGRTIPRYVFPYGNNKFGVTPVPDAAYTLKYDYFKVPTQLSAYDDTTDIPTMWDYVIVNGAMWYGNLFKSDEGAADRTYQAFENGVNRMRSILINKDESVTSGYINYGQRNAYPYSIDEN